MNEFIIQWYSRSIFNFQPFEIKQLFRKIETKSKQLITNNPHQEFNNICINENLLPIYNIYLYMCICMYNALILHSYNYYPLCVAVPIFRCIQHLISANNKFMHFDIFFTALNRQ